MREGIYKLLLRYTGTLCLLTLQITLFALLWFYHYVPMLVYLRRGFFFWGNWAVIGFYLLFLLFFNRVFDGHKLNFLKARTTFLTHSLTIIFANIAAVLLSWVVGRYYFSILPILLLAVAQMLVVVGWSFVMSKLYLRISKPVKTVVIHGDCPPNAFQTFLEKADFFNSNRFVLSIHDIDKSEEEAETKILENEEVVLYDLPSIRRNALLKFCYENSKNSYVTPKISDILVTGAEKVYLSDIPLLKIERRGIKIESLIVKRLVDITLAVVGLVITSPFFLISAIIIKIYDGGKVFFTQERMTRNETKFEIIKFRTMREDSEEEGPQIAKQNDSRITPYGKILRATHLDELPQLVNILKGEMTLVGPRPERIENIEKYEKVIPEFKYRLAVKAGLTGYAQLYGKYDTTPYDKIKLDLEYIENHSLLLDFKLILLTVKVMFQKDNAEGVKRNQSSALLDDNCDKIEK